MISHGIIQHSGVVVDLSRVKSIQVIRLHTNTYSLCIDLNSRVEYIFNPGTSNWEKETFNDRVGVEYGNYDMANAMLGEWMELWGDYRNSLS